MGRVRDGLTWDGQRIQEVESGIQVESGEIRGTEPAHICSY